MKFPKRLRQIWSSKLFFARIIVFLLAVAIQIPLLPELWQLDLAIHLQRAELFLFLAAFIVEWQVIRLPDGRRISLAYIYYALAFLWFGILSPEAGSSLASILVLLIATTLVAGVLRKQTLIRSSYLAAIRIIAFFAAATAVPYLDAIFTNSVLPLVSVLTLSLFYWLAHLVFLSFVPFEPEQKPLLTAPLGIIIPSTTLVFMIAAVVFFTGLMGLYLMILVSLIGILALSRYINLDAEHDDLQRAHNLVGRLSSEPGLVYLEQTLPEIMKKLVRAEKVSLWTKHGNNKWSLWSEQKASANSPVIQAVRDQDDKLWDKGDLVIPGWRNFSAISLVFHWGAKDEALLVIGKEASFTSGEWEVLLGLQWSLSPIIHNAILFQALESVSETDPLTGLTNLLGIEKFLEKELSRTKRYKKKLSYVLLDIDKFKDFNDTFGHLTGNHVLKVLATTMLKVVRKSDLVARYAGDEFVFILPETDTMAAERTVDRLMEALSATPIKTPSGEIYISVSAGISQYPPYGDHQKLFEKADQALYRAKNNGRNKVEVSL